MRSPRRALADSLLLWAALLTGGVAAFELRQPWTRSGPGLSMWLLLGAAGVCGGYALRRHEEWLSEARPEERPAASARRAARLWGLALLAVACGLTAWIVVHLWPNYYQWHGTVLPWLAAMVLVLTGGALLGSTAPGERDGAPSSGPETVSDGPCVADHRAAQTHSRRAIRVGIEVAAFLLIAALAVVLRLYRINEIPAGIYVDETNGALDALYILEGHDYTPFGCGWYGTPTAYAYCMALLFKLFGASWGSLKAVSLIPAILTVLALYPLGRLLFGPLGGLSATAFLACNRWHVSMSRWGWNETVPPLFQIVATFFLLRGLRDRRASDFALSGVISGLMMYTYLSSRLALATLGLFAVYLLLCSPGGPRAGWRRHWRGLLLYLVAWSVAVAPIAVTHITDPFTFSNRVSEISIFRDVKTTGSYLPLWLNVIDHLRFFHQIGDHQGKHNLPDEPHADPLVGVLLVVGLGYALLRLRDSRRGLLWLWLLLGMAGGVFSSHHESPQSYRTLTAVPAVALLAGDVLARSVRGAHTLARLGRRVTSTRQSRTLAVTAAAVTVAAWAFSASWEAYVYFARQARHNAVKAGFNPVENGVAHDVLAALDAGTTAYVSPRFYGFSPLRFLVYGVEKKRTGRNTLDDPPYHSASIEQDLPVPPTDHDALFLLDEDYWPLMDYFRYFYPDARLEQATGPDGVAAYIRARVSRDALAATTGLVARFVTRSGVTRERVVPTISAEPPTDWVLGEWTGSLAVPDSGRYDLDRSAGLEIALDDEPWRGPAFLGRGLHSLCVRLQRRANAPPPDLAWLTPDGHREAVPARRLFRLRPPSMGLRAFYFHNPEWAGPPVFSRVTPVLLLTWGRNEPFADTDKFSAAFLGALRVSRGGTYRFHIEADDGARLLIDGRLVAEGLKRGTNSLYGSADLDPGDHPIEIDYFQWGGGAELRVLWEPPGEREGLIPPQVLVPAPAS